MKERPDPVSTAGSINTSVVALRTVFVIWQRIVQAAGVIGKQVHDARLVAVCHLCGVSHILTFNTRDFARFAPLPPGLTVVDPATG